MKITEQKWKDASQMLLDGCSFQEIADKIGVSRQCVHNHFVQRSGKRYNARPIVYAGIKRYIDGNRLTMRQIALRIFPEGEPRSRYYRFANIATGRTKGVRIEDIFTICRYMNMPFEEAFAPIKEDDPPHDNSAV